jgi:hypothetical protein
MEPKVKMGLIAGGIVGGLVLLAVVVVLVASLAHTPSASIAVQVGDKRAAAQVEPERPSEDVMPRICSHAFWKVKVTPAMVEKLIATMRGFQADTFFYVNDRFETQTVQNAKVYRDWEETNHLRYPACKLAGHYMRFDMMRYGSRPGREELLKDLLSELDYVEFHSKKD